MILAPEPVVRIVAIFSRYDVAFTWAVEQLTNRWGPLLCDTPEYPFEQTQYYTATMGPQLRKKFLAFRVLVHPSQLVQDKRDTNDLESEYAERFRLSSPEPRPLNLDPGYVTLSKLVLASTKDFAHRIYLDRGIFAEITLSYHHGHWTSHPWTFPDYSQPTYHPFLTHCRDWLRVDPGYLAIAQTNRQLRVLEKRPPQA